MELQVSNSDFVGERQGKLQHDYKISKKIGDGEHYSIREVVHRESQERRIVKIVPKSSPTPERFMNELQLLR